MRPSSSLSADGFAVVGMGKLGGCELNYASDVDVMLLSAPDVDPAAAARDGKAVVDIARRCFRVDLNLRPEGRNGALVRTLASYEAYWDQWAEPWEFQALLRARAVGGDPRCAALSTSPRRSICGRRPFTAESLRSVRAMKVRSESEVARRGLSDRELKLGPGGIRDIEFAVQLLQLVHGGADPELRGRTRRSTRSTSSLTPAMWRRRDAEQLSVRLPLPAHSRTPVAARRRATDPRLASRRDRARPDWRASSATSVRRARARAELFIDELRDHQSIARAIHERLWFRPLLEDFARGDDRMLTEEVAATRLAAFGFTDVERTRQAVRELTRGLDTIVPVDAADAAVAARLALVVPRSRSRTCSASAILRPDLSDRWSWRLRSASHHRSRSDCAGCSVRAGCSASSCGATPT